MEIALFVGNIHEFGDLQGIALLRTERKTRLEKFVQHSDKARCLIAGLLERKILGVSDDAAITQGAHGKPLLKNARCCYNISHAGDYVVMAVSGRPLGVDIEPLAAPPLCTAQACFTSEEAAYLAAQTPTVFFDIWTAKESIMKATGQGLSLPPEGFSVLPLGAGAHEVLGQQWYLEWFSLPGHRGCVACAQSAPELRLRLISRGELLQV